MGIRRHEVFFDHNPTPSELIYDLLNISRRDLNIELKSEGYLIIGLENKKAFIELAWDNKRPGPDKSLIAMFGDKYVYPFPEKNQSITIETGAAKYTYLEVTVLYILKMSGGIFRRDFELPSWAGNSWDDRPKKWWQLT